MGIVIYPPTLDWSYMKQRPQHLMKQFTASGHDVLYFNKHNRQGSVVETIGGRLHIVHHMQCYLDHYFNLLPACASKLLWSSWSSALAMKRLFVPDFTVYDCVDDFPDWEKDERLWLSEADAIVCTSAKLYRKMTEAAAGKPVCMVPNGCEWEHFSRALRKPSLFRDPRKQAVIAYIGAWAPWVDVELIERVGRAFPSASIVIAGPYLQDVSVKSPNVHFTGYMDYESLPELLATTDVCIIPFKLERITESTNPIKMYEYLSAGLPVVSTELPEAKPLQPYVTVTRNAEEFVEAVRDALKRSTVGAEERSGFARSFDWGKRYRQAANWLGGLYPGFAAYNWPAVWNPELASLSFPLQHASVNSYYMHNYLPDDPPLVGLFGIHRYETFLRLFDPSVPKGYQYVYLDFDLPLESKANDLTVGWTYKPVGFNQMTYANKPFTRPFKRMQLEGSVHATCSLDVTELFPPWSSEFPVLHLQRVTGSLVHLLNPRLTFIYRIEPVRKASGNL